MLADIFKDIDTSNNGQISRQEMFTHLKHTRELDFDRLQESEGEEVTPKNEMIPGFEKV